MGKKKPEKKEAKETSKPLKFKVEEAKTKPIRIAPVITLAQWFASKQAEGKVRPWQYETIKLYANKQGLKDQETADQYDEMFKKF